MVLLRHLLGDALRRLRLRQGRTLREVSATARVSLGYLSEVERGRKEASSELLASICDALGAPLSQVLREVSDGFALAELQNEPAFGVPLEPALARPGRPRRPGSRSRPARPCRLPRRCRCRRQGDAPGPGGHAAAGRQRRRRSGWLCRSASSRVRTGQHLAPAEPLLEQVTLTGSEPKFDKLARDITDMVPV